MQFLKHVVRFFFNLHVKIDAQMHIFSEWNFSLSAVNVSHDVLFLSVARFGTGKGFRGIFFFLKPIPELPKCSICVHDILVIKISEY